ncbi:MAG: type II toxin-antitoxin system VapC family toxin [Actinomycetota bacterium]
MSSVAPDGLWVLDTSVAASWFFTDEAIHLQALAVRAHLRDEPRSYLVPPLFHAELVHVLARKSGRNLRFVRDGLALILRLGIRTLPLSEAALLRSADWACRGLSGYDATFVALAEDVQGRWLTADERAAKVAGRERAETLKSWVRTHRG